MLNRIALLVLTPLIAQTVRSQVIDSVHVFRSIPSAGYSTSLAETTGWKLQRSGAAYVSVDASDLPGMNEQLDKRRPVKHMHAQLPGLTHIGFLYLDKAAHVFCLAEEQGLIIDLTARRQFLLEDWTDRIKLRAALVALDL